MRVLDTWIIAAPDVLYAIILRDEIHIHGMLPIQQTTLHASNLEENAKH